METLAFNHEIYMRSQKQGLNISSYQVFYLLSDFIHMLIYKVSLWLTDYMIRKTHTQETKT